MIARFAGLFMALWLLIASGAYLLGYETLAWGLVVWPVLVLGGLAVGALKEWFMPFPRIRR